jgi:thioredoxin-related protein
MKVFYRLLFLLTLFFQSNTNAQTNATQIANSKVIVIYGSPDCHYCIDLKKTLIEKKKLFIFFDIDTNESALNEMLTKLNKAKISTNNLQIPVVDKYGVMYVNNASFKDFVDKIVE